MISYTYRHIYQIQTILKKKALIQDHIQYIYKYLTLLYWLAGPKINYIFVQPKPNKLLLNIL
jgi:hypothetical protein